MDDENQEKQIVPVQKPKYVPKTRITVTTKPKVVAKKKSTNAIEESSTPMHTQSPWRNSQIPSTFNAMSPFAQFSPVLPNYNSNGMMSQALLPSVGQPSVPPYLVPAKIKLLHIPIISYRQSYVIEPTGQPPGTYLSPDEIEASGGMLTYISAPTYPQPDLYGGMASYAASISKDVENVGGTGPDLSKPKNKQRIGVSGNGGVRSMIQKGVIGRSGMLR